MFIPVLIVLIIGVIILKITGMGRAPGATSDDLDLQQIGTGVLELVKRDFPDTMWKGDSREDLGVVLKGLLTRLGFGEDEARDLLECSGFSTDGIEFSTGTDVGGLSVHSGNEENRFALERALLVGIQMASADDDYAGVGDGFVNLEALESKAEAIELRLFSETDRSQYVLCQKAALVLQDMLQAEPEGARSKTIKALLQEFDIRIVSYQDRLSRNMEELHGQDALLWGDSSDRRMYYFKMGVTNSLRRSGKLKSLGHLYRYKGVNYDVLEAYGLAAQECKELAAADNLGIERLLQMKPADVQGLVQQRLNQGRS
jgi:hypothetical protein